MLLYFWVDVSCSSWLNSIYSCLTFRCGHCKTLAPHWSAAAKALGSSPIKLAKVDAIENKKLADKFEIKGFPTIKLIKNGKASEYNGGRTESEIVNWVNKRSGPPAVTLTTVEELTKFQESNSVFVLGVFSSVDSSVYKDFLAIAGDDDKNPYAIATADAIKTKLAVTSDAVVLLKDFDDLRADFPVTG